MQFLKEALHEYRLHYRSEKAHSQTEKSFGESASSSCFFISTRHSFVPSLVFSRDTSPKSPPHLFLSQQLLLLMRPPQLQLPRPLHSSQQTTPDKWSGSALVKGRGTCKFELEIGTQQNAAKPFTAYTNMLCIDMTIPAEAKAPETYEMLNAVRLAPESTILSGALSDKTIAYKADRIVSHGQDKCGMESLDITPFGSGQIAAEWKDNCGGGEMTLVRR